MNIRIRTRASYFIIILNNSSKIYPRTFEKIRTPSLCYCPFLHQGMIENASRIFQPNYFTTGCPKKNGTQVSCYNFVTVNLKYLKFCRNKFKVLNDMHGKNQVNRVSRSVHFRLTKKRVIFGLFRTNSVKISFSETF